MALSSNELKRRIHACWLGKAAGGTLGTPHEGKPGPLDLSFYDPVPTACLPNDDLDLQLVWLHHLRTAGAQCVTPENLAEAWDRHVLFPFDEYGVARRNRSHGLSGPPQGATDNFFAECMGAAIRSELWACLAPGDPERAAGFAWADAVVDHCGEGVWAEVFHAAVQAAAFVESDRERLIETGLRFLPTDSRLKGAILETQAEWRARRDWRGVRDRIARRHSTGNFTDVVCNLCFEILGWYAGNGDFGRSICAAVNCGLDTDCTGATLGSLLGIINPDSIPPAWREPIGEGVVVSDAIVGIAKPADLTELTAWTMELGTQLSRFRPTVGRVLAHKPADARTLFRSIHAHAADHPSDRLLDSPSAPAGAETPISLHGTWSQWSEAQFGSAIKSLRVPFHLTGPMAVKLMLFYRPGGAAWIDGRHVLRVSAGTIGSDPFLAPSFHRAGPISAQTILPAGDHTLTLALARPPAGETVDLVFGLADPATNFWLADAFPVLARRPA